MTFKLIFSADKDQTAHAREVVRRHLGRVESDRPMIPSIALARTRLTCERCTAVYWGEHKWDNYCDSCEPQVMEQNEIRRALAARKLELEVRNLEAQLREVEAELAG